MACKGSGIKIKTMTVEEVKRKNMFLCLAKEKVLNQTFLKFQFSEAQATDPNVPNFERIGGALSQSRALCEKARN